MSTCRSTYMCTLIDSNTPNTPHPTPPKGELRCEHVHTSSCSKSCLSAAALGCVIAELQCPRWLNTLTVEYSAQHFYSQHNWWEDGKMNAKLPPPVPTPTHHHPNPPPPLTPSSSQVKAKSQEHSLLYLLLSLPLSPLSRLVSVGTEMAHRLVTRWRRHWLRTPLTHLQMAANWHLTILYPNVEPQLAVQLIYRASYLCRPANRCPPSNLRPPCLGSRHQTNSLMPTL